MNVEILIYIYIYIHVCKNKFGVYLIHFKASKSVLLISFNISYYSDSDHENLKVTIPSRDCDESKRI